MQRKELEEQLKSMQTAIQEKQPSGNVIAIMKRLQMEVVPTEELLRVCPLSHLRVLSRPRLNPSPSTRKMTLKPVGMLTNMISVHKGRCYCREATKQSG